MRDMDVKLLNVIDGIITAPESQMKVSESRMAEPESQMEVTELKNDSETKVVEETKKVTRRTKK